MKNFLTKMIRDSVGKGVGDAISKAVKQAVEPAATQLTNQMAEHFDRRTEQAVQQSRETFSGLEGAFSNLERSMQGYATQMGKNMKVCPGCGQPTTAEKTYCPACGTQLPDKTLAEGAVCMACGRQNNIGTRFCEACGAKLPAAIEEERAAQERDAAELAQWEAIVPQYPRWNCGGSGYCLENCGDHVRFSAGFAGNHAAARAAVSAYRALAQQYGFRPAGQYPTEGMLYKKIGEACYCLDTEHCFEGDEDAPCIYFYLREPTGGFDYVKPEPRKQVTFKDLFKR